LLQGFAITWHFSSVNAEAKVVDGTSGQFKDVKSVFKKSQVNYPHLRNKTDLPEIDILRHLQKFDDVWMIELIKYFFFLFLEFDSVSSNSLNGNFFPIEGTTENCKERSRAYQVFPINREFP
jgi:hypothetical protein